MPNKLNDLEPKVWLKFQKSWFIHNPPPRRKGVLVHPAKFPETMAQEFIEFFTKKGETVLDPMAGTGSALVAALRVGRNSYGIELNLKYAKIAQQIIEEERTALGKSVKNLKSEIINGDASHAVNFKFAKCRICFHLTAVLGYAPRQGGRDLEEAPFLFRFGRLLFRRSKRCRQYSRLRNISAKTGFDLCRAKTFVERESIPHHHRQEREEGRKDLSTGMGLGA